MLQNVEKNGLYRGEFEKDNCGFGLIVNKYGYKSHRLLKTALTALAKMKHRGAIAADGLSGDGCGVLLKIDHNYYRDKAGAHDAKLGKSFATGLVFFDPDIDTQQQFESLKAYAKNYQLNIAGIIDVVSNNACLGAQALASKPLIKQIFVDCDDDITNQVFEARLYVFRRFLEKLNAHNRYFYMPSLSAKTIVYKALVTPENLANFYTDLADTKLKTDICIFHQRFSTNTLPQWRLAQPFRYLAHNGEINTIKGNRNWVNANGQRFLDRLESDKDVILPITNASVSDSCSLDHVAEALHLNGMSLLKTLRVMIPAAWQNKEDMDPDLRAFYEYYGMHMGAWDGPAGVVTTDGRYAICLLDRNGLRPARWHENVNGDITFASEAGVYDGSLPIVKKGRVGPGQMVAVDTQLGCLLTSLDIDEMLKTKNPYKEWLNQGSQSLFRSTSYVPFVDYGEEKMAQYTRVFDLHYEEQETMIQTLAQTASEAVGSMGDDTPIAVLSNKRRTLYAFFRQQFAQVTNPAIDSLRETVVMSLKTFIGGLGNITKPSAELAKRIVIESPILSNSSYCRLQQQVGNFYHIDLNYPLEMPLLSALENISEKVLSAISQGHKIIELNDEDIKQDHYPVHALLATGYVHHLLNDTSQRCAVNLIVKTATARDPHQCACLLGYGATAIFPYLSYHIVNRLFSNNALSIKNKALARRNYRYGINKGLRKIMSKMGISTMTSYRGAQLFEIIGLDQSVVDLCFKGTTSRISGFDFKHLHQLHINMLSGAFDSPLSLEQKGLYRYTMDGEYHAYNPQVTLLLQEAVTSNDYQKYEQYRQAVNGRGVQKLRDLLKIKSQAAIDIGQVMPIEEILQCFDSAGMSLGAISPEAHEAMAQAMNELGGKSNSGEGGEATVRHNTVKRSKIKQIASGRFGVTPEYLINAQVIQIKIAQGAKPGEGGQIPGKKVNHLIAKLRFSVPGVTLISPPPHHDIYSIEDLAQLIFDLKQVNSKARISVKLVSEAGVGTIAAGVVKAYADMITISGHDGGTGASPLTSIIYAGTPWEIGLSETHQTLVMNDLRNKITLQVDGGLKTGLDVIKGAILGAESFAFGTAPMIALGCKYLRICHLNNCATGVATQDEVLRSRYFKGTVEKLKRFFTFVAMDVRQHMAGMGVRHLKELVGRTDFLEVSSKIDAYNLDLSQVVHNTHAPIEKQTCQHLENRPFDQGELAHKVLNVCQSSILSGQTCQHAFSIGNTDRSMGAMLSGYIAKQYGDQGAKASVNLCFDGVAGQSFGAFNIKGLNLTLIGEANDYVGKSMSGGCITVKPMENIKFNPSLSPIVGNTCLYGATGGELFAYGQAGERFAVRNSGAIAVVEGVGDHCCEYMTGGIVIVLGETGINFGAGMTGGIAFVLDKQGCFVDHYNNEFIKLYRIQSERMQDYQEMLHNLLSKYVKKTQSKHAQAILAQFSDYLRYFWLVSPQVIENSDILVHQTQAILN